MITPVGLFVVKYKCLVYLLSKVNR